MHTPLQFVLASGLWLHHSFPFPLIVGEVGFGRVLVARMSLSYRRLQRMRAILRSVSSDLVIGAFCRRSSHYIHYNCLFGDNKLFPRPSFKRPLTARNTLARLQKIREVLKTLPVQPRSKTPETRKTNAVIDLCIERQTPPASALSRAVARKTIPPRPSSIVGKSQSRGGWSPSDTAWMARAIPGWMLANASKNPSGWPEGARSVAPLPGGRNFRGDRCAASFRYRLVLAPDRFCAAPG